MRSRLSESLSRLSETSLPERGAGRGCCLIWHSFPFWMVGMRLIRLLYDGMMGLNIYMLRGGSYVMTGESDMILREY